MNVPSRLQGMKIRRVQPNRRHPAVSVKDLAFMLEIDLVLGRHGDFRRRLQNALNDAARQGARK